MSSAWLLPEHIADVLPAQARHIEDLRRVLLDVARGYGCELVMPPLAEHIESLLSGTGRTLDLKTFKLVDQLSGRTLGIRADATPQVARIDAHLLNRGGVTRLAYCGPVLHTLPASLQSTREPLQFGAEVYGHAGLEADLEVQDLALDCLRAVGIERATLDLGDARILRAVLSHAALPAARQDAVLAALAAKDAAAIAGLAREVAAPWREALVALPALYGGDAVLDEAARVLPADAAIVSAVADLRTLARHAREAHPSLTVGFDLADLSGYAYYSGARFAVYLPGASDALVRGGRYDEVGAVFGRKRPAIGFSLDLKALAPHARATAAAGAIRAPWSSDDAALRAAIRALRERGETVVCVLPGHDHEGDEFDCDRELVQVGDRWAVRAL